MKKGNEYPSGVKNYTAGETEAGKEVASHDQTKRDATKTRTVRAKAAGTNAAYISMADRLLEGTMARSRDAGSGALPPSASARRLFRTIQRKQER
jgi:hypothetical protein